MVAWGAWMPRLSICLFIHVREACTLNCIPGSLTSGNVDGDQELSGPWFGVTHLILLNTTRSKEYTWCGD